MFFYFLFLFFHWFIFSNLYKCFQDYANKTLTFICIQISICVSVCLLLPSDILCRPRNYFFPIILKSILSLFFCPFFFFGKRRKLKIFLSFVKIQPCTCQYTNLLIFQWGKRANTKTLPSFWISPFYLFILLGSHLHEEEKMIQSSHQKI